MRMFLHNILRFIGFSILVILVPVSLIGLYFHKKHITLKDFPPPMISDSYSFDDKMLFARNKKADILCLGSSMSFNNINSEEVIHYFQSDSYLNLSSWGMNLKDIFYLFKTYASIHKPGIFIINSSLQDFLEKSYKKVDYADLKKYLTGSQLSEYYMKYGNLIYYLKRLRYSKMVKSTRNVYASLDYDKYGGVPLDSTRFIKNDKRWNYIPNTAPDNKDQYSYLDSISEYCKTQNIKLIFFEAPVREGLLQKQNKSILLTHIANVEKILLKDGHTFINPTDRIWPDSLFVDGAHFNAPGAALYTHYCFEKLGVIKGL
jgi:hypothetical protein